MDEFKDKVVLVTGAGRGIGRAIAEAFAARGAIVAANDISPVNLDETIERIAQTGGRVIAYVYDVAKKIPIQTMINHVLDDFGRIDFLINNAAVEPRIPLLDMDEWDWQRTLDVNLSGPFLTMQVVGRVMREQGGGVIVNIGAAEAHASGLKDRGAYLASKLGLIGLSREAARELSAYNIRVNVICPGEIDTGKTWEAVGSAETGLLGRKGKPEEVAELALYLCSNTAGFITGQTFHVDGGKVMN
jgi:NAD(P)-dependent dehydrogenase (short-subunit alcohol dehydrogenase family)